jgi:sec-independent protein translocase protein TatC
MTDADADAIEATRAPLMEHLIELRSRLIRSLIAVAVTFVACMFFADKIFNILLWPYEIAAGSGADIRLIYTAPQELFLTHIKLAIFGAIFISFPIIAMQLYKFIAPGLYRKEKAAFRPFLIATPILFLTGACFVFFVAMPLAMRFFLSMQQVGGNGQAAIQLLPRTAEYLSLVMKLILGFGICFQMPVVLVLLARVGFIDSTWLRKKRKYMIVAIFGIAAIATPPDVFSQCALALPLLLLYEASIYVVRMVEKRRAAAEKEEAAASSV